jgi:hypothetical protein
MILPSAHVTVLITITKFVSLECISYLPQEIRCVEGETRKRTVKDLMLDLRFGVKRAISVCASLCLIAAPLTPSIAVACEGGGEGEEGGNKITASATLFKCVPCKAGSASITFTNNNKFFSWEPKGHTVKQIQKTSAVWTFGDKCAGTKVAAKGGTCSVEIKFTANGETGRFISELEMEGAPATANVKLEGEE